MSERRRNDVRYLTLLNNNLTLLSNVRYLTLFRRLSDVYKIPPNKVKVCSNFFLKVCLKIISLDASTFHSETVIKLEKKYCKIFQTANPTTMGTKMEYSSV